MLVRLVRRRLFSMCGAFLCVAMSAVMTAAQAAEDAAPILISESGSTRAITGSLSQPDSGRNVRVFPAGSETAVTLFVANLDLLPNEGRTAFRADVQDASYRRFPLEVISFEPSSYRRGVYAITVRLRPDIGNVGDVLARVTWRGMSSNRVRISIGHQGGRIADDDGAQPTPLDTLNGTKRANPGRVLRPWAGDTVRFMQQAGFGSNAALESRIRRIGFSTWLTEQMEDKFYGPGLPRYSTYPYPNLKNVATVPPTNCDGISGNGNPVDIDPLCFRDRYTMWPLQNWFFREALYGDDQQLRRRVSWALSQIFVVGGRETVQPGRMLPYINILDRHAFGNYKDLLREITLNPAMGAYLDMAISTSQAPNENYPREILQLFSIGVDQLHPDGTPWKRNGINVPSYDQNMINQFTKVFTGWANCQTVGCPNLELGIPNFLDPMVANPANHDMTQKVLFGGTVLPAGQTPEADLQQALKNIFEHPNVGPFFSKLMIQQLVTSNPTPAYVGRVAAVFNNNGAGDRGDMKALIRAILLDPEARGNFKTDPDYGHLREPVLFTTNILKPFNPQANNNLTPAASCNGQSDGVLNQNGTLPLDQEVWMPPSVFNYYPMDYYIPGTDLAGPEFGIFSTGTALKRPNLVNAIAPPNSTVAGGIPVVPQVTILQGVQQVQNPNYAPCGTRIDLTRLADAAAADPSGNLLLDILNAELLHKSMSEAMRADILTGIQGIAVSNPVKRARAAYYLVATSPQFQVQR